jgi:hypothetical protein
MSLGYETYEDNRDFEQTGLTGNVIRYATEGMTFPCYIICSTEEKPVEMYKIEILRKMFSTTSDNFDEDTLNSVINIYFTMSSQTVRLGKIISKQVKAFLHLFEGDIIKGYLDKDTLLENDYLYVLSS